MARPARGIPPDPHRRLATFDSPGWSAIDRSDPIRRCHGLALRESVQRGGIRDRCRRARNVGRSPLRYGCPNRLVCSGRTGCRYRRVRLDLPALRQHGFVDDVPVRVAIRHFAVSHAVARDRHHTDLSRSPIEIVDHDARRRRPSVRAHWCPSARCRTGLGIASRVCHARRNDAA